MSGEPKDPAIKLFGKTIPLPELPQTDSPCSSRQLDTTTDQQTEDRQGNDQTEAAEYVEGSEEDDGLGKDKGCEGVDQLITSSENSASVSGKRGSPGTPPVDRECSAPKHSKPNEKQNGNSSAEGRKTVLKKPNKILPCPRCNSMETKFCYYNNYNMNQPRHFCRNCQRYWTAGGTMRNVPVGAGRRKNKSSSASSNNRHPFPLEEARPDVLGGVHHSSFEHPGSSGKTSHTQHNLMSSQGLPSQVPCFPEAPWAYPWVAPLLPSQLCSLPVFPVPIYPIAATAAYWGCGAMGSWSTVPSMPQPYSANMSTNANSCSSKDSPTLGKHPREDAMEEQEDTVKDNERQSDSGSDRCLWIPKTLRIDDPSEAAKSSVWATLGINKTDSASEETRLKAFQPKVKEKNRITESSPALLANPAAMSRSFHFHESS